MRVTDLAQVMEIEYASFSTPWSELSYRQELLFNPNGSYFVARLAHADSIGAAPKFFWRKFFSPSSRQIRAAEPVIGYSGFWLVVDEAHISTIAVNPAWRRRGIGERLLIAMIERARALRAETVTLEVRVSNAPAQSLYRKYGFEIAGTRPRYYNDNGEDAFIMTTPRIQTDAYRIRLQHAINILA
ncbi:MAG: ribosomal protein S18-alanine N-acetyltransferase [Chloroflexi bacterium]|nr:ribosomal protein S18-alanine N-acetyltransferase [Chloroflexota bacterium]